MDQIIQQILGIFSPEYILSVVFSVYAICKVLERYVPILTPSGVRQWVVRSTHPVLAVAKQDWRKWVTVAVGALAGLLFVQAGWMPVKQAVPSFLLAEVGYSYILKYVFTALKMEYKA